MSSEPFTVVTHVLPASHIREYPQATHPSLPQETALQISAKQYIPRQAPPHGNDTRTAITILSAPALGIPKECYEPTFTALLNISQLPSSKFSIRSIWIADVAHEGASFLLNEQEVGSDPGWFDHARDLLHLVNMNRSSFPRPIIGLGHSRGGPQFAYISLMHPRLLSGLILVESMMINGPMLGRNAAYFATNRRDIWPDRAAAEAEWSKSKSYRAWDKRALKRYMEVGLTETPTLIYPSDHPDVGPASVTLTTPKHQEAWAFGRPNFLPRVEGEDKMTAEYLKTEKLIAPGIDPKREGIYVTVRPEASIALNKLLPELRPPVLHIFGAKSPFSTPETIEQKMKLTGTGPLGSGGVALGKVQKAIMPSTGHFPPLEKPDEFAHVCGEWLNGWAVQWQEEESFLKDVGREMSEDGNGRRVSQKYIDLVAQHPLLKRPVEKGRL